MKPIVLAALIVFCAQAALADPTPGRYCAHQAGGVANIPGAAPGGSEIPAVDVVVDIENRQGANWVTFRDAAHEGSIALAVGPVAATPMPGGALSFSFHDARAGSGDGTLTQSGAFSIHRTPGSGGDSSFDRNFGTFRLSASTCTEADKALKLTQ